MMLPDPEFSFKLSTDKTAVQFGMRRGREFEPITGGFTAMHLAEIEKALPMARAALENAAAERKADEVAKLKERLRRLGEAV